MTSSTLTRGGRGFCRILLGFVGFGAHRPCHIAIMARAVAPEPSTTQPPLKPAVMPLLLQPCGPAKPRTNLTIPPSGWMLSATPRISPAMRAKVDKLLRAKGQSFEREVRAPMGGMMARLATALTGALTDEMDACVASKPALPKMPTKHTPAPRKRLAGHLSRQPGGRPDGGLGQSQPSVLRSAGPGRPLALAGWQGSIGWARLGPPQPSHSSGVWIINPTSISSRGPLAQSPPC
jgi:hypothetical protein